MGNVELDAIFLCVIGMEASIYYFYKCTAWKIQRHNLIVLELCSF